MRLREPAPLCVGARRRPTLLRALLRYAREQGTDLRFAVAAVTAKRPDGRQLSGLCPTSDRFRVNPEHSCHLGRRKQWLGLWGTCRHFDGLSSWTQIEILRLLCFMAPFGAWPRFPEPAVDVQYGLLLPYCHHQR